MFAFRPHKQPLILIVLTVCIIGLALLYFFFQRPSDGDYEVASNKLQSMLSVKTTINKMVGDIKYSTNINDGLVLKLENSVTTFNDNFASLSKTSAVSRDSALKTTYDQYKSTFTDYGQAAKNLVDSLKKYLSVRSTCTTLVDKISKLGTVNDFDNAAKECKTAIDNAKSASYTPFNDQFLADHIARVADLVAAYREVMIKASAGASTISLDGVTLATQRLATTELSKLEFLLTPDPSNAFSSVNEAITKQKTNFLR